MRRFILSAVTAVIIIILFVVMFLVVRGIFTGDDAPQEAPRSYDFGQAGRDGSELRFTIKGSIVGDELHREIRVSVDKSERKIEILKGYQGEIEKSATFPNTEEAYNAFHQALVGAGFTTTISADGRGIEAQVCSTGHRFSYEVAPNTSNSFRTWNTNCGQKLGTFAGNSSLVRTLFQRQIPEYGDFLSDVRLN